MAKKYIYLLITSYSTSIYKIIWGVLNAVMLCHVDISRNSLLHRFFLRWMNFYLLFSCEMV